MLYEVITLAREKLAGKKKLFNYFREFTHDAILKCFNKDLSFRQKTTGPVKVSYDEIWNQILLSQPDSNKSIAGAFVNWDNTPRHKRRGSVFDGVTPEKIIREMPSFICQFFVFFISNNNTVITKKTL